MGKGRDKRRKHEDPETALARTQRQAKKASRNQKDGAEGGADGGTGGLDGEEDITDMVVRFTRAENKRKTVSEVDLPGAPSPRANAVWLPFPGRDGEFVMFGGEFWDGENTVPYNDLLVYNMHRNKWRQVLSPCTPCPRSSCQGWTHRNFLYVHGGEIVSRTQSQFMHFKDLWRFDLVGCVWEELTKGKGGPSARSGHRVAPYKRGCAVLFGGFYDNGQQTTFYDDLWILSDVDAGGTWTEVLSPRYGEKPHPRSGHSLAAHNDEVLVFGGYYTFRANRFQRAEATVLHDLWAINPASPTPMWQKVKLAGIPPPIRCGMATCVKDKRMYLFGGVVDLDGAGGKTVSTFHNDIFVLNLETKRFFPMIIRKSNGGKKKGPSPSSAIKAGPAAAAAAASGGSLAAEINAVAGTKLVDSSSSSDDDDDDEDGDDGARTVCATVAGPPTDLSAVTMSDGRVMPCPRMNAMLCAHGNQIVLFGGVFELGKREVTLSDVFSLNVNTLDTYVALHVADVRAVPWNGGDESGSDAGSWEDGSTVAPEMMEQLAALDDLDEDDEEEFLNACRDAAAAAAKRPPPQSGANDDDDDDDGGGARAGGLAARVLAAATNNSSGGGGGAAAAAAASDLDGRTNIRGKIGKGHYKEQLKQQLSASSLVPTPVLGETSVQFFARTEAFWMDSTARDMFDLADAEQAANRKQKLRIRRAAEECAEMRFLEATDLLRQIADIEAEQKAEQEALRQHLQRRQQADSEAQRAIEEASIDSSSSGSDSDADEAPATKNPSAPGKSKKK